MRTALSNPWERLLEGELHMFCTTCVCQPIKGQFEGKHSKLCA